MVGIVSRRDLVDASGRVGDHARPVLALPESMGVLDALRRLQAERQQLVGEIYDEFDPDTRSVQRQDDGR